MKQKNNGTQKLRGPEGFDQYYSQIFPGRWDSLKNVLLQDTFHASVTYPDCEPYFMDPASICAALCLPLEKSETVLDMCAAPGGKTLIVSANLPESASLTSNERSPERKNRLAKVVSQSLPDEIVSRITVTCSDGATLCQRENKKYDRILLDAPCSSERHVLKDPKYLNIWSQSRLKTMAMEQWALLSSAWRILEVEGYLLYGTCALSQKENDEIISRLLKKFSDAQIQPTEKLQEVFEKNLLGLNTKTVTSIQKTESHETVPSLKEIFEKAQRTEFGFHILPDSSDGYGPLYFSLVKKLSTGYSQ